jgi:endonuclease G
MLSAQSVHISHCLVECPQVSSPETEVVVRHLYAAAINADTSLAEWVAYRVLPDTVGVASLLPRFWQQDELVSGAALEVGELETPAVVQPDLSNAQDREYRINEIRFDTGDRGRLAPMTSFAGTPYWGELNYLSNMSPLPQSLRLGSWSRLDQAVNGLAAAYSDLYVVSGPLYSFSGSIGDSLLPDSYFKVVSDGHSVAAFVLPTNLPIHARFCDQLVPLDQVESRLDRKLLPGVIAWQSETLEQDLGCSQ